MFQWFDLSGPETDGDLQTASNRHEVIEQLIRRETSLSGLDVLVHDSTVCLLTAA